MKFEATPQQRFLILSMAFAETLDEREPTFKKASLKKAQRDAIPKNLVRVEKRRASHLVLQDDAWQFIAENLGSPLSRTPRASVLLQTVLKKLASLVGNDGQSLREFIHGIDPARPEVSKSAVPATEDAIRAACLSLAGGQTGKRVRLADLRQKMHASRDSLDSLHKSMQQAGRLVLFKMDNPAEITPADESAALIIAGNPRHLVYLEA